jgi:hypothetical protein
VSRVTVGDSGGNPVAVLIREKRARVFARLTPTEGRLILDRTKLVLALALGALALLPAAAAQAATATPGALSFSSSYLVPSAPQTVTYSVTAADSDVAHEPDVTIGVGDFNDFSQTNNCFSLPASGSGSCTVSVTFKPQGASGMTGTKHSSLDFIPLTNAGATPFASVSLTGIEPAAKKKKCHKKGKKASAAKKCKKKKH